MANQKLDKLDRCILKMVSDDARVPFLEVARACNVSGAAIHQRIQKLTSQGILKGSQFVIDPERIGYETCAYIGLNLKKPEDYDRVVMELEKIREVTECHYTTGNYDMFIKIYARNNHHLLNIIHDKLQPLGLSSSQTLISFHSAFERQLPIADMTDEDGSIQTNERRLSRLPLVVCKGVFKSMPLVLRVRLFSDDMPSRTVVGEVGIGL